MHGTWALTLRMLKQDARLLRFHLLRLGVAILLGFGIFVMLMSSGYSDSPGKDFLSMVAQGNFLVITFCGIFLFANVIAEEKEDQTLGLLRMTKLGPLSLLLGKVLPRLIQFALLLVIQLPLVFLTRTLGGVSWSDLWTTYAALWSQLIVVVGLSLLSSVVMRTAGGATTLAIVLTFAWAPGMQIVDEIYGSIPGQNQGMLYSTGVATLLRLNTEVSPLAQIFDRRVGTSPVLGTIVVSLTVAGIAFLFSVVTFEYWNQHESTASEWEWIHEVRRRIWQKISGRSRRRPVATEVISTSSESHGGDQSADVTRDSAPGIPAINHIANESFNHRPSCRSWSSAIAWKEYFLLGGGKTGFIVRVCLLTLLLLGTGMIGLNSTSGGEWGGVSAYQRGIQVWSESLLLLLFYPFIGELIYMTVNLFAYELRRQTWESLQILPISFRQICWQKVWGAGVLLTPWGVTLFFALFLNVIADLNGWGSTVRMWLEDPLALIGVTLQIVTQLMTFLIILTWFSIRMNPWVAIVLTGLLYWGIGVVYLITAFIVFGLFSSGMTYPAKVLFNIGWIGGAVVIGVLFARSIRSKLIGSASTI